MSSDYTASLACLDAIRETSEARKQGRWRYRKARGSVEAYSINNYPFQGAGSPFQFRTTRQEVIENYPLFGSVPNLNNANTYETSVRFNWTATPAPSGTGFKFATPEEDPCFFSGKPWVPKKDDEEMDISPSVSHKSIFYRYRDGSGFGRVLTVGQAAVKTLLGPTQAILVRSDREPSVRRLAQNLWFRGDGTAEGEEDQVMAPLAIVMPGLITLTTGDLEPVFRDVGGDTIANSAVACESAPEPDGQSAFEYPGQQTSMSLASVRDPDPDSLFLPPDHGASLQSEPERPATSSMSDRIASAFPPKMFGKRNVHVSDVPVGTATGKLAGFDPISARRLNPNWFRVTGPPSRQQVPVQSWPSETITGPSTQSLDRRLSVADRGTM